MGRQDETVRRRARVAVASAARELRFRVGSNVGRPTSSWAPTDEAARVRPLEVDAASRDLATVRRRLEGLEALGLRDETALVDRAVRDLRWAIALHAAARVLLEAVAEQAEGSWTAAQLAALDASHPGWR